MSNIIALSDKLSSIVKSTSELVTKGYYSSEPVYINKMKRISMFEAISNSHKFPVFAELKFSAPVSGFLKESSLDSAVEVLKLYSDSTVTGLSILTEPNYFQGTLEYLDIASSMVPADIPILMKDFFISREQISCAKRFGASTILLISKILPEDTLSELLDYAHNLSLEVLLEVNTNEELENALEKDVNVIGINNRNLNTMDISLDTTENILRNIEKKNKKFISLSGINTINDVIKIRKAKADGILVGTALMKSSDPKGLINQFSNVSGV